MTAPEHTTLDDLRDTVLRVSGSDLDTATVARSLLGAPA